MKSPVWNFFLSILNIAFVFFPLQQNAKELPSLILPFPFSLEPAMIRCSPPTLPGNSSGQNHRALSVVSSGVSFQSSYTTHQHSWNVFFVLLLSSKKRSWFSSSFSTSLFLQNVPLSNLLRIEVCLGLVLFSTFSILPGWSQVVS